MSAMEFSKALNYLCHERDTLDLVSRRSQLDELVQCLTLPEIHYFRKQLSKFSAKNGDIFIDQLPPELLQKIACHLYLEDFVRVRAVSRLWRKRFSCPELCLFMIKRHFQFAWEYHFSRTKLDSFVTKKIEEPCEWLQRTSIDRIRRERGLSPIIKYNFKCHQNDIPIQYCNGRMAFQKDGVFEIKDLFTQSFSTLATLNRRTMHKWLLSDQLLVGIVFRPTELCAWKLSLKDKPFCSVRLPTNVHSISAYKNKVGIVTAAFEIIVWTVGGPLQTLQTRLGSEASAAQNVVAADIFFHPNEQDRCFVVYHARIDSGSEKEFLTRITVQSFISRKLERSQLVNLSTFAFPYKHQSSLISSEGVIGIEVQDNTENDYCSNKFRILTYDMRSNYFTHQKVDLHPTVKKKLQACNYLIWRDQIHRAICPEFSELTSTLEIITISKSLIDIWDHNNIKKHENFSYLWGENRQSSTAEIITFNENLTQQRRVWADDNFVILFTGEDFLIWYFHGSKIE